MAPFLTSRGKALLAVAMSWLMVAAILLVAGRSGAAWPLLFSGSGLLVFLLLVFYSAVSMAKVVDGVHLPSVSAKTCWKLCLGGRAHGLALGLSDPGRD